MNQYEKICKDMGQRAKTASFELAQLDQETLDSALLAIADAVEAQTDEIMAANELDLEKSVDYNLPRTMIDRLTLTPSRIALMAEGVRQVAALESPVGSIIETITRPNGLIIEKRSVPFGVIGIIFEARPNVTIDAGVLCLKTANATILRGGKEAFHTNQIIVSIMRNTLESLGINGDSIQLVEVLDRDLVGVLLQQREYIDVIIPRGGAGLIRRVVEDS
ncbi:MAG: gamma-glutamyl-phosphate reductase, partial [Veillonella sp.]|nr:gamma-glutamyl-phosphate reductase [Veillonella sp.]